MYQNKNHGTTQKTYIISLTFQSSHQLLHPLDYLDNLFIYAYISIFFLHLAHEIN